jgi:uncharacterized protein (DUF433 family)
MIITQHIEQRGPHAMIRGRNLKAKMVARMHLWEGYSVEEVMKHYELSAAEVYAALAFYEDNREALDAEYEAHLARLRESGTSSSDFRQRIAARQHDDE